jgi:hypothetical protein
MMIGAMPVISGLVVAILDVNTVAIIEPSFPERCFLTRCRRQDATKGFRGE